MKALQILIFSFILIIVTSCGVGKSSQKSIVKTNFSKEEISRILEDPADQPMRVFKITNATDSLLLRKQSREVSFLQDSVLLSTFIQRLHKTVIDPKSMGVGIAAPQVGVLSRIIWVQRFDKEGFPWDCIINPKIISYSDKKQICPEGCLSIPEKTAITKNRSYSIIVEYQTIDGAIRKEEITEFTSVIFQHEIDHLDGILFIDHLEKELTK